jgi:hypothetical protein
MLRTITITGARGGQGTSTVAAALAVFTAGHHPTALITADRMAMAALLGLPDPADVAATVTDRLTLSPETGATSGAEVLVIDAGTAPCGLAAAGAGESYVVVRGPCYLALAGLLRSPAAKPDGVILVAEQGRSLTARDVAEITGLPIVATVEATPRVARALDAGLLVARLHHLRELAALRPLATDPFTGRPRPSPRTPSPRAPHPTTSLALSPSHPPSRQPLTLPSTTDTDLPGPQGGPGVEGRAHRQDPRVRCRVFGSRMHV